RPPRSTLFPYTTLFRSELRAAPAPDHRMEALPALQGDRVVVAALPDPAPVDVGERHLLVVAGAVPVLVDHDHVVQEARLLPQAGGAVDAGERGLDQPLGGRLDLARRPVAAVMFRLQHPEQGAHVVAEAVDAARGVVLETVRL